MKKIIKLVIRSFFSFFCVFINPVTIKLLKLLKKEFWSTYYSLFLHHDLTSIIANSNIKFKGEKYISLGKRIYFGNGNRIECWDCYKDKKFRPELIIGNNVGINDDCHIGCINRIIIGDNTLIGSKVLIEDHDHGCYQNGVDDIIKVNQDLFSKGPIIIGNNVWIGENVCILANVHIGDNAVIGAGSIVTHDVEANSIYAGNPARKIK